MAMAAGTFARRTLTFCAGVALFGGVAVCFAKPAPASGPRPLKQVSVDLGPEATADPNVTVAISPDGRRLVFPVRGPNGQQLLATKLLGQAKPTLLPGTEGGSDPFFSPDGRWIGFIVGGQIKKISVHGGAPVTLGSGGGASEGAAWADNEDIIAPTLPGTPLFRIPAGRGGPQPLTKLGPGEATERWPQVLPGGNAVLFTASSSPSSFENATIEAASLMTGQVKVVQRRGYYGRYLPGGYLVYVHRGTLFGEKFDAKRLQARGTPVPLVKDVAANPATGGGQFDFSNTGTLVYLEGKSWAQASQIAWLDSSGKMQPLLTTPGQYGGPRISSDGRELTFQRGGDIYVYDLRRGTTTRLTFTGHAGSPTWAPDGKHLVYRAISNGFSLYWIRSDGKGNPQLLLHSATNVVPWSFSPRGRYLAYFGGNDIWTLPLDLSSPDHPQPGKPQPFLRPPANAIAPAFSPDGHWIAYRSEESGSPEIWVRPFPAGSGGKWQVSSSGGLYAVWSANGRKLFYESTDNRIMVVDYTVNGTAFVPGRPRVWSDKRLFYVGSSNLDLAPDGKRFVVLAMAKTKRKARGPVHVVMLLNFFAEVERKIP